jgi:hypothetical protein
MQYIKPIKLQRDAHCYFIDMLLPHNQFENQQMADEGETPKVVLERLHQVEGRVNASIARLKTPFIQLVDQSNENHVYYRAESDGEGGNVVRVGLGQGVEF